MLYIMATLQKKRIVLILTLKSSIICKLLKLNNNIRKKALWHVLQLSSYKN
jgi:hypothetical protein